MICRVKKYQELSRKFSVFVCLFFILIKIHLQTRGICHKFVFSIYFRMLPTLVPYNLVKLFIVLTHFYSYHLDESTSRSSFRDFRWMFLVLFYHIKCVPLHTYESYANARSSECVKYII